MMNLKESGA
jgi:hypothetical protein